MKAYKKIGSKRPLKSRPDIDFKNSLDQSFRNLTKSNRYAAFLNTQIWWDLKILQEKRLNRFVRHSIDHSIPLNGEFKFLPLQFGVPPFEFEDNGNIPWFKAEKYLAKSAAEGKAYYRHKKSWIIGKILHLAVRVSYFFDKISRKHKIPVTSLEEIFYVITGEKDLLKDRPYFATFVSKFIPIEERERFLLDMSRKVYGALEEAFWVLIVIGMAESANVTIRLAKDTFENAQAYLMETACYPDMEEKIREAKTVEDLKEYVQEHFSAFMSFRQAFDDFYEKSVKPLVKRGVKLREEEIIYWLDQSSVEEDEYSKVEGIQDRIFGRTLTKDESEKDEFEGISSGNYGRDLEKTEDESVGSSKRRKSTGDFEGDYQAEIRSFSYDTNLKLERKMLAGLVRTYKLRGDPLNLIRYLRQMVRNLPRAVSEGDFDKVVKAGKGISLRTWRRYKKDLKEGKITLSEIPFDEQALRNIKYLSIKDLSIHDIDSIKLEKKKRQRHRDPNYFTLNELADELSRTTGKPRSTMKKKLAKLLKLEEIDFHKEGKVYRIEKTRENL